MLRSKSLWIAVGVVVLGSAWLYRDAPPPEPEPAISAETASAEEELPPLPWEVEGGAAPPAPDPKAPKLKPGELPPVSVGNNGSFKPRPADERQALAAETNPVGGAFSEERTAVLLGDVALAPAGAPDEIKAAISAANLITNQPYRWGGGHASFQSKGYDCSGAVSYALAGAGLIGAPATSGQLMGWGKPGRGRWLTVYANAGHTYAVIAGLRWDTVGNARGEGPRWHPADAYPSGYVARHIPGL